MGLKTENPIIEVTAKDGAKSFKTNRVLTQPLARFMPATLDKEKRTVTLAISSEDPYQRGGFFTTPFMEVLSHDPAAIRMGRLNSGAPLLDSHNNDSVDNVLGVLGNARVENGQLLVDARFSQKPKAQQAMQDVADGIISKVSVGYMVHKYELQDAAPPADPTKAVDEEIPTYKAVDWEPFEASLVGVPADNTVGVKSFSPEYECTFIGGKVQPIAQVQPDIQPGETVFPKKLDDELKKFLDEKRVADELKSNPKQEENEMTEEQKKEAKLLERKRIAEIQKAVSRAKLEAKVASEMVERDLTIEEAKSEILDMIADRDAKAPEIRNHTPEVSVQAGALDETETRRAAAEAAILHRYNPSKYGLPEMSREYVGVSLLEMGKKFIKGETKGRSKLYLAERSMNSTSDFPFILANVAGKVLLAEYQASPKTYQPIVKQIFVPDFKLQSRDRLGDAPALERVYEGGEIKKGTIGESREQYSIATYAKMLAITRQAIINDDLNAFAQLPAKFGRMAADLESTLVWGQITDTAALMGDGNVLFDTSVHKNQGAGSSAISVTTLGESRKLLRQQVGIGGLKLNLTPKYLIVPVGKETLAEQYVTQTTPVQGADVNPFAGKLTIIAEPRLDDASATAYYLAADPSQVDIVELAYLEGQAGPSIESNIEFDTDGVMLKARMDVGAKVLDWRGLVKQLGA